MDKRRAEIERSLRREQYPRADSDPRILAAFRRRFRPKGGDGLQPAPVEPHGGGGGLTGGAAVAIDPNEQR